MKQKAKTLLLSLTFIATFAVFSGPQLVSAAPLDADTGEAPTQTTTGGGNVNCGTTDGVNLGASEKGDCAQKTAFKFGSCKNANVTIGCMIASIMSFLSILVGILVVGGITVGGIVYSTGGGNPAQTKKGVTIITNSVLGLALYLLMFAIINFLVPGGVLT